MEILLRKMALFPFYYKPSIGVRAVFRSGRKGSSLSIRHYHFYSSAREDKQKVKASGSTHRGSKSISHTYEWCIPRMGGK
jgi:hypothetical protein